MAQSTNKILMIRPRGFRMNEETAVNNYYQDQQTSVDQTGLKAMEEFDLFADLLKKNHVSVFIWDDPKDIDTPDNLFPNNWISFHDHHQVVLYPMFAINRRKERNTEIIRSLLSDKISFVTEDFTHHENDNKFLEGTGSLVLDRIQKTAYAAISPRTNQDLVLEWCDKMNFKPVLFHAFQTVNGERLPIYHTNVMMSIGTSFAAICTDSIDDQDEKELVIQSIKNSGKELISLSEDQIEQFAGNMLEVKSDFDETLIVMSSKAFHALDEAQKQKLGKHGRLIHSPLEVIERFGGGSARCMLAEIF